MSTKSVAKFGAAVKHFVLAAKRYYATINLEGITDPKIKEEITVEFDRPTALQIDGETIRNVTSYTMRAQKKTAPVEEPVVAAVAE